jgi:hypothetical protein
MIFITLGLAIAKSPVVKFQAKKEKNNMVEAKSPSGGKTKKKTIWWPLGFQAKKRKMNLMVARS